VELLKYIDKDMKLKYSVEYIYKNKVGVQVNTEEEYIYVLQLLKKGIKKLGFKYPSSMIHNDIETREENCKLCAIITDEDLYGYSNDYDVYVGYCTKHILIANKYIIIETNDIEV
jgi:hypothetical protein